VGEHKKKTMVMRREKEKGKKKKKRRGVPETAEGEEEKRLNTRKAKVTKSLLSIAYSVD